MLFMTTVFSEKKLLAAKESCYFRDYEMLRCAKVDAVIAQRLNNGEKVSTFGPVLNSSFDEILVVIGHF